MNVMLIGISGWIQSFGTIAGVLLALLTLIVLLRYADDTATIAKVSASQIENSQMPCLSVIQLFNEQGRAIGWAVQNQGVGPAINITFTGYAGGNQIEIKETPPLAPKENRFLHHDISEVFARWPRDFKIEYESLSGGKYSTTVNMEGRMHTEFHKPAEKAASNSIRAVLKKFWRSL